MKNTYKILPDSSKLCVFIVFVLFLIANCSLLSQITWQKVYDGGRGKDDNAFSSCPADGSNIFIIGFEGEPIPYFYVLKVNQLGDTLWTRSFGAGGKAYAVASSGDGGCVFTGDWGQAFAIKLNNNGDTVWQRFYNGNKGYDIKRTSDGGYVLCGEEITGGVFGSFICKTDSLGIQQWYRNYSGASAIDFVAVELVSDGYILSGDRFDQNTNTYQASTTKTDNNGIEIWSKIYRITLFSSLASRVKLLNQGFILAGTANITSSSDSARVFLLKINANGDSLKTLIFSSNHYESIPIDLLKLNDNKYFISFYHNPNTSTFGESKLRSIDSSLNVIHQSTLRPDTNTIFITSLIQAPFSGSSDIIAVGGTDHIHYADIDTYIARLDSSITQLPPIGIESVSNGIPSTIQLNQNYPNPFNPLTNIGFVLEKKGFVELKIFDPLGRELFRLFARNMDKGRYSAKFDGSKISSGVYFYQLVFDGQVVQSRKMVLYK